MVPPTLCADRDSDGRASLSHSLSRSSPQKAAESPPIAALSNAAGLLLTDKSDRAGAGAGAGALVRLPPRLHAPFVSPEFAGGLGRATRLDADVSRHYSRADGGDDGRVPSTGMGIIRDYNDRANRNSWWEQQPESGDQLTTPPQTAPLYTVRAGDGSTRRPSNSDVLVALPSPLPPSLKLAKRLAVNGMMSVLQETDDSQQAEFRLKSAAAAVNAPSNTLLLEGEAESATPQQQPRNPCKDLSPFVTEATCSWGQELGTILGQAVPDCAATAGGAFGSGTSTSTPAMMSSSLSRLGLTTTGLFPQTMHLRFSSPVCVSSVHVRASSVLGLVVQPGGKVSAGSEDRGGKSVRVPADSIDGIDRRLGGATSEAAVQDIDVDVRGEPSFRNTRSISVIITSGSEAFCSVRRIYALGTQA